MLSSTLAAPGVPSANEARSVAVSSARIIREIPIPGALDRVDDRAGIAERGSGSSHQLALAIRLGWHRPRTPVPPNPDRLPHPEIGAGSNRGGTPGPGLRGNGAPAHRSGWWPAR